MDGLNRALIESINNGLLKAQWYSMEPDEYYLKECDDWLRVAREYINEIEVNSSAKNSNNSSN